MSDTKLTFSDIFTALVGFFLFAYSIFLIGKMSAGGNLSTNEIMLLSVGMLVNAICVLVRK